MIIGTAGHVDHGKSTLVEALTGRRMDRLAEERRRGITIDLNFAPLDLGDGQVAGIVDVPGHEDLVRTMVAGATGIDLLLLVIAADEGVMPQTREHLAIAEALDIPRGLAVISKADLVEPAWLELVRDDLAEQLLASSIRFEEDVLVAAPPIGMGVDRILGRLRTLVGSVADRDLDDLFRLPVDRSFSKAGVGTIVTGSCWSGRIAIGDEVLLQPGGHRARVRSIESHGVARQETTPGDRVALGLAGVDRYIARRGTTVVDHEGWGPTHAVDALVHLLPDAPRPLTHRTRVRVLLGTAEVMARVHAGEPIPPGGSAVVRLTCERPLVARGEDRIVLRSYSPVTTIGGGRILDPSPERRSGLPVPGLAAAGPIQRLPVLLGRRREGLDANVLPIVLGLTPPAATAMAKASTELVLVGDRWTLASRLLEARDRGLAALAQHHHAHPSDFGMPLETLRGRCSGWPWLAQAALDSLVLDRTVVVRNGTARLPKFKPSVAGGSAAVDRLVQRLEEAGLQPPTVAELAQALPDIEVSAALRLAVADGRVVPVERDRHYSAGAIAQWRSALLDLGAGGDITVAALRDRLGLSRKYLIPLLEWSDRAGDTTRAGDVRRLTAATRRLAT